MGMWGAPAKKKPVGLGYDAAAVELGAFLSIYCGTSSAIIPS